MAKEVWAEVRTRGYRIQLTNVGNMDVMVYEGEEYLGQLRLTSAGIVWRQGGRAPRSISYRNLKRAAEST
jgi:hypothetical protein